MSTSSQSSRWDSRSLSDLPSATKWGWNYTREENVRFSKQSAKGQLWKRKGERDSLHTAESKSSQRAYQISSKDFEFIEVFEWVNTYFEELKNKLNSTPNCLIRLQGLWKCYHLGICTHLREGAILHAAGRGKRSGANCCLGRKEIASSRRGM